MLCCCCDWMYNLMTCFCQRGYCGMNEDQQQLLNRMRPSRKNTKISNLTQDQRKQLVQKEPGILYFIFKKHFSYFLFLNDR